MKNVPILLLIDFSRTLSLNLRRKLKDKRVLPGGWRGKGRLPRADLLSAGLQQGYTLIELLLYVSIIGSLLITVSLFFVTATEARIKNQSIVEVNQQGTLAMEYITQTIRNANAITAPSAGNTSASITLAVPTAGLSPTIFDLNSTSSALQVKEGSGSVIPLTNSKVQISNLSFKNLTRPSTPGVVQVSFTVSRINSSGKNEYDYRKTFTSSAALRWP